jgi:glycosyltransferase involved in cell wall biosynthesis
MPRKNHSGPLSAFRKSVRRWVPGKKPDVDEEDQSTILDGTKRRQMRSAPLISVIVPIYNSQRYIEKCLRSIMTQTLSEIEIICVDDASPDDSSAIVEKLAREDDRINLIRHARNLGLGGARNTGIAAARAAFITGVDGDDWIRPNMMERLWEASGEGKADIVACGFAVMHENGALLFDRVNREGQFRNDKNSIDIFNILKPAFWGKIWRKSLFEDHGITFPEKLLFEDLPTTPRVLRFAKDIRVIPDSLYCYIQHEGSISNSISTRHIMDYFCAFDILSEFLVKEGLDKHYEAEFHKLIGENLHYYVGQTSRVEPDERARLQELRFMLLLKLAYLELDPALHELPRDQLQQLLLRASTRDDLARMLKPVPPTVK